MPSSEILETLAPVPAGESCELEHLSMQMLRAGVRDLQCESVSGGDRGKDRQTRSSPQKHNLKAQLRWRNEL